VAVFLTLGIAGSGLITSFQTASAVSSYANLWAVPTNSRIDDGNLQILRLKFALDSGNPLDRIRITLDKGTSEERVFEFDANGKTITPNDAFVLVDGSVKFKTDGYMLQELRGKFKIGIDKTKLTVGEHDALAEVIREGGAMVSDTAHFKLRAGSTGEADLVPEFFGAWNNIKQDKKYSAFVKEANEGTGNAGAHEINIYFSDDNVLDSGDELVGDKHVGNLKAGKDRMVHVQFELDDDAPTGPAYLIVKVDGDDEVSESDENNNTKPEAITVIEWTDKWEEEDDD
jgi:hypothetical protein